MILLCIRNIIIFFVFSGGLNTGESASNSVVHLEPHNIDVFEAYGNISQSSIRQAITDASGWLRRGGSVVVFFKAGIHDIATTDVTFSIDNVSPAESMWLIFKGAGMDQTVLRFDGKNDVISGRNVVRVRFEYMTFARQHLTTSQGVVVSATDDKIILDVQDGYPGIASIMGEPQRLKPGAGRFVRQYHIGVDGGI